MTTFQTLSGTFLFLYTQLRLRLEYIILAPKVIREITRLVLIWGEGEQTNQRVAEFTARLLMEKWVPIQVAYTFDRFRQGKAPSRIKEAWFYTVSGQIMFEFRFAGFDVLRAHQVVDSYIREEAQKRVKELPEGYVFEPVYGRDQ